MNRRQFGRQITSLATMTTVATMTALPSLGFTLGGAPVFGRRPIKAKRLKPGDTIGIVSPASAIKEESLERAIKNLECLGFKVKLSKNVRARKGFIAGSDQQRLDDLHTMFADTNIDGIWCARGGYGTTRILPHINYPLIRKNPKVLIGYSDITALLHAIHQKTGLVCFHGPVGASEFTEYTTHCLRKAIMEPEDGLVIQPSEENAIKGLEKSVYKPYVIRKGQATGKLIGGNLSLLASLAGTKFPLDVKNKIIFIEEVGEKPYRIDRMLTQLKQAFPLEKAAGIMLGIFEGCEASDLENSLSLAETLTAQLYGLNIPVVYGMSFGHIDNQMTLPIGTDIFFHGGTRTITFMEKAVI